MKRRVTTVALALLLAMIGTGAVLAYVAGADGRAMAGLKAVTVLVAQQQIPTGTPAGTAQQDGSLRAENIPERSSPPDAVSSITADLSSLVMSADVMPGQVLLRSMLVPAGQASGGLDIPVGMVAVTIPLCLAQAVAGYVHAGSQVAVFDTVGESMDSHSACQPGESHQAEASQIVETRVVLPEVQVLSVGPASSGQEGSSATTTSGSQPQGSVLVTLAVDQADAERIIQLTETGLPYLALLTPASRTGFDTAAEPLFQQ